MAFDLDDDELKATRKMYGLDDEETDIEILEKYLEKMKTVATEEMLMHEDLLKLIDYKELKAIENLMQEYYEIKYVASTFINRPMKQFSIGEFRYKVNNYKNEYIPKSKVRDEIEKLNNMKIDGEVFTTAVNFAKKIIAELLEE